MPRHILIIDGHPDPDPARFCHALADAYAESAENAGHGVERLTLAALDIPLLRTRAAWEDGETPAALRDAQAMIGNVEGGADGREDALMRMRQLGADAA